MMRFIPPAFASLALFIIVITFVMGNAPVFDDPDTAWHIAAGDLIRSTHSIPFSDPWSFTAADDVWYNLSWLFDVGLSFLFEYTGFSGLYALTVLTFGVSTALMSYYCVKRGASPLAVFLTTILALPVINVGVLARPNMCSVVLTLLFYFLLHRYRTSGKLYHLIALPPLMALWVNLHGGFLLAFLIMGVFFAEAVIERNRERAKAYALVLATCLVASLINPYGLSLYYGAYKTLSGMFDKTQLVEWKAVSIGQYLPMTALLFVILCVGDTSDKRIPLVDRILSVIILILSLSSMRHTIIGAMLLMPYVTQRISTKLYETPIAAWIRNSDSNILSDLQHVNAHIKSAIMAFLVILFVCTPFPRNLILQESPGFLEQQFPVDAAAYVAEHYPNLHFLNDYNIGGYLDYLWRGKVKVFVDGRSSSLYSEDLLSDYSDYMNNVGLGLRAEMVVNRYHIDGLIISNTALYASDWRWNPEWRVVYHDKIATVYLRSKEKAQSPTVSSTK